MKVSILSQRTSRGDYQQRPGGKIRPGIKVLTNKARENPRVKAIYDAGVARRLKFTEIEKLIKDEFPALTNPMYPRNTPYFNVAVSDFGMPEIVAKIYSLYGEVRQGDNEAKLYRFPVVFHSDDMNEVYPNEFRRYGGTPNYESHYGDDGIRYCRYLPEVTAEMVAHQKANRIKRPMRREKVIRGECDPGVCQEYLTGQCKFRGKLNFYIPGVPTTGLMVMETTSEYAAETIFADLQNLIDQMGGIPRHNPNNPGANIFYITKVQESRTYFDESGKKQSGLQWVPKLQADIDMGTLLTASPAPTLTNQSIPAAWLAAPKGMPEALLLPTSTNPTQDASESAEAKPAGEEAIPSTESKTEQSQQEVSQALPIDHLMMVIDQMGADQEVIAAYFDQKLGKGWFNVEELIINGIAQLEALEKSVGSEAAKKLIKISIAVCEIGIPQAEFQKYATLKYGKGFTRNPEVLDSVLNELKDLATSGSDTVRSYIKAQIENALQSA